MRTRTTRRSSSSSSARQWQHFQSPNRWPLRQPRRDHPNTARITLPSTVATRPNRKTPNRPSCRRPAWSALRRARKWRVRTGSATTTATTAACHNGRATARLRGHRPVRRTPEGTRRVPLCPVRRSVCWRCWTNRRRRRTTARGISSRTSAFWSLRHAATSSSSSGRHCASSCSTTSSGCA
uniref:(northern house mosquito) hypothetical protein n=1 Tax=Culex pipiens TaxID=7175 RepID=A0A8D8BYA4_CULPI